MSDHRGTIRTMSVREATVAAGYEVLARADFGDGIAFYRGQGIPRGGAGGVDSPREDRGPEVLLRIVVVGNGNEREARAASRVEHASALRLQTVRTAPGYRVLVFEPFRGRSLARELERVGYLDARRALHVAASVARVLAHAHARDAVHGQVTAANIVLGVKGEVKLAGFGAREPESADRDVVDLGHALWRAIAGDLPPGGSARLAEPLAPLGRILERCMRLRPEIGFYPDARALVAALEGAARRAGEARADMTGRFSADELAALLQMIELSGRSGRLEVAPSAPDAGSAGAIAFRAGKIVAARAGAETGQDAVLRLLTLACGRFRMWFGDVDPTPSAALPIAAALLEAHRLKDEAGRRSE